MNDMVMGAKRTILQSRTCLHFFLGSLFLCHPLSAAIVTQSDGGVQARTTSSYQGIIPDTPSYIQEDSSSYTGNTWTTATAATPGISVSGLASNRNTQNSGRLTATAKMSASSVQDYYLQGYAQATASVSINSPSIRTFHAGRGVALFNINSPDLLSVTVGAGTTGTPGSQRSSGVIVWAEDGFSFPGEDPNSANDPEQGNEPADVTGAFSSVLILQRSQASASVVQTQSTAIQNFGHFNHFLTPVEGAYGRTAPQYFARQWSESPKYLFTAPDNLITSVLVPNATQGGDTTFELSFGDYSNPTTMSLLAGTTTSDFGSLYPDGIPWFIIKDVNTDLDAPVLERFVLGVTFADDGLGELRSWELVSVPEPDSLFTAAIVALGLVARMRHRRAKLAV